jgi:acyl-homoserine lactone acylase PvdQ
MSRTLRRAAPVAALALALAAPGALAGGRAADHADVALNIIPSGQYGTLPPPAGADRQARMYDGLTPLFDKVTDRDLRRYFKSERFGTAGECPCRTERVPRRGVRLVRDTYGVPHITAQTRDALTFATGWVMATDRGLLLEQARYNARVAAIDAPGLSAITLTSSLRNFRPTAHTERELAKQTGVLRAAGIKGRRLLHDIDVYVQGINAKLRAEESDNAPWTRNDVYALNALKGQFLGQGGGDEARRSQLLASLTERLGTTRGFSVFDDLRQRDPAGHPATIRGRFPYGQVPRSRAGNVLVDPRSLQRVVYGPPAAGAAAAAAPAPAAPAGPPAASNILILDDERSQTGRPLFVGGPQIGYFYPGLTLEMDLHAPGVDTRGVTAAPFPGYMLIGRGPDFAWTLTSAGADNIDQYVEELCEGSDIRYRYKGRCRSMSTFVAGTIAATATQPEQLVVFRRTRHGPVIGYATVNGRRVAISQKRASYGRDTLDQLPFQDLTLGEVDSPRSFVRSFLQSPQTFNAFYADDRDIAMVTTGRLPLRARDVDPGLPTRGDGEHEWRGWLSDAGHPQQINPRSGTLINWNNKTARGFEAADDAWNYGSIHRVDLLTSELAKRRRHDLASVTSAMNAAATQDLRSVRLTPTLARVLAGGPAPSPRAARMLELLQAWRREGSSRLDRDLDGKIDAAGAAIMDAAWPRLAEAALSPVLGPELDQLTTLGANYDLPPRGQSGGWHSYLDRDLRRLLGDRVSDPFANRYCGGGDLAACRTALWEAMDVAGAELEAAQGPDPAAWRSDALRERIPFVPGLLPYTMRYANRPSGIQQVISFDGHRPRR